MRIFIRTLIAFFIKNKPSGPGSFSLLGDYRGDLQNIFVGENSSIHKRAMITNPKGSKITIQNKTHINAYAKLHSQNGFIKIGNNCSIHSFCVLYGEGGIEIGDHVRMAAHTAVIAGNHGFNRPDLPLYEQKSTSKGIKIGNDVWIGNGVKILDGAIIGDHVILAAGTVVTKNIPPNAVVMGVPGEIVRYWR